MTELLKFIVHAKRGWMEADEAIAWIAFGKSVSRSAWQNSFERDRTRFEVLKRLWWGAEELRRALRTGEIEGAGQPPEKLRPRTLIPATFWLPGITITFDGCASENDEALCESPIIHFTRLTFDVAQVQRVFPTATTGTEIQVAASVAPSAISENPVSRVTGGRPPHKAQDGFIRELVRLADGLDGLPSAPGELTRHMQDWAEKWAKQNGKQAPCDSTVKEWLDRFDHRKSAAYCGTKKAGN